jgi:2-polyprenyl-3-methyl-5-hydroxy-6-metoxy-1,4-benzoquinol methylase
MIKRILKYFFVRTPVYWQLSDIQQRIANIELAIRRIENSMQKIAGKDLSLCSGEREVSEALEGIPENHRLRYAEAFPYIKQADRILDIACGVGYGSAMMSDQNPKAQIVSVDISSDAIEFAKVHFSRQNIEYICGDIESIKSHDYFDAVTCFETIEHIENDVIFLEKISKKIKKGGILFLSTPNEDVIPVTQGSHFHYRHYNHENLVQMIRHFDFDIIRVCNQKNYEDYQVKTGHDGMYLFIEARKI